MFKQFLCAALLSTALLASAALANDQKELRLLNEAKLSLSDAITAAEKHHDGARAIEASLDDDHAKPVFDITVTKDGAFYDVMVDGTSGAIISSHKDLDD